MGALVLLCDVSRIFRFKSRCEKSKLCMLADRVCACDVLSRLPYLLKAKSHTVLNGIFDRIGTVAIKSRILRRAIPPPPPHQNSKR